MNAPFEFSDEEIRRAAAEDRLLSVEVEFTRLCNYRCPYCYVGEPDTSDELTAAEITGVLKQAQALGARKAVILGGEPLLCPELQAHLALIGELGMTPEVFTNGALIDEKMARMLWKHRARVAVKLNSLDAGVQERMTGIPGALELALGALDTLERAGYRGSGLLSATSVICDDNAEDMTTLWRTLRERGITPYFEMMTPQGRLLENDHLQVTPREIERIFREFSAIDAEFGLHWEPQPPLAGERCLRHLYSCLVAADGKVYSCVGITSPIGDIRTAPLAEILRDSHLVRDLKHHREMIKEPCRSCEKSEFCYGCRGAAYQLTGDYLAADPLCWRNCGRGEGIVTLPCDARKYLPHGAEIAMVKELLSFESESFVSAEIPAGHAFLNAKGELDRAALIELAAQAAAVLDGFRHDGVIAPGMLAGASRIRIAGTLRVGEKAKIGIVEKSEFNEWNFVDFRIAREDGAIVAEGELKLCVFR